MGIPKERMRSEVVALSQEERNEAALEEFSGAEDICLRWEYCKLYETESTRPEVFSYEEKGKTFFMAYLKNSIPGSEYYDFETPYGYSGPLSNTSEERFLRNAWDNFYDNCVKSRIIAGFLRFNPILGNHLFAVSEHVQVTKERDVVVMTLDQKSADDIWKQYDGNTRNKIRLAMKNAVYVRRAADPQTLKVFMTVYYKTMDRLSADKFYYFKDDFFEKIAKNLKDNHAIFIAYLGSKPVGGAMALFTKKILCYFLSSTVEEGRRLGVANLLRHQVIGFARESGMDFINFGGGRSSDDNDELLRFKKGFSDETKSFYIGKFMVNPAEYSRLCKAWLESSSAEKAKKYNALFLKYRS